MAEGKPKQKELTKLLEHLLGINVQLEKQIWKLNEQVNLKTFECIESQSKGHIEEIKEVVALMRTTNSALLDHKNKISDVKKKLNKLKKVQATNEKAKDKTQENEKETSEIHKLKNGSLKKGKEHIEIPFTSIQKTEDCLPLMKQWRENVLEKSKQRFLDAMFSPEIVNQAKEHDISERKKREKKNFEERIKHLEETQALLLDSMRAADRELIEIKQWRDKCIPEQSDMVIKINQLLNKKQENNIKTMKDTQEYNQLMENSRKQDSQIHSSLEKNNKVTESVDHLMNDVNKKLKDHSDKIDKFAQIAASQSKDISVLEKEEKKNVANCTQELHKLKTMLASLENKSNGVREVRDRVCKPYSCQIHLNNNTPVTTGEIISTFYGVKEHNGSHFNRSTGKLVAPDDGFYLVIVTLKEKEDKRIAVSVFSGEILQKDFFVKSAFTSASGSTIVAMKKGEELYFKVTGADDEAMLHAASGFSIVRL
ncbi:putative autophagy-related protein 11 [Physella acuta]|uniref:putative autophagy-related protein 11 n=1 Tax=Physella acuta TaxID=109671 RepID=UPI0027DC86A1|nr:putative autophagy-related protein 11 [Physella acuta]